MTKSITIYGIKACDTMKKARAWLDAHGVDYEFYDYKTRGIDEATLRVWVQQVRWETLLNRTGTTFRKLPDSDKTNIDEIMGQLFVAVPRVKLNVKLIIESVSWEAKMIAVGELLVTGGRLFDLIRPPKTLVVMEEEDLVKP